MLTSPAHSYSEPLHKSFRIILLYFTLFTNHVHVAPKVVNLHGLITLILKTEGGRCWHQTFYMAYSVILSQHKFITK